MPTQWPTLLKSRSTDPRFMKWWSPYLWFTRGDIDAFASVSMNVMSTTLICVSLLKDPLGNEIVFGRIIPGLGVAIIFGNIFYGIQCANYASKTRKYNVCAQPFGINTPGAYVFITSIILPVYYSNGATHEARRLAWEVGVTANFVQGIFEIIFAIVGPQIQKAVKMVALLTSLASVGLAFLFVNIFQDGASVPIISFICTFLVFLGYFSRIRFGFLPTSILSLFIGSSIGWITGYLNIHAVKESRENIKLYFPYFTAQQIYNNIHNVGPHIGLIIPVSLTVAIGTIQCVTLCHNMGDMYNIRWTMLGVGIATCISALFGSVFGMAVYIGYPGHKKMGAKIAYNWMNGIFLFLVCMTGISAPILEMIAIESINPIIIFVGLVVCIDTLNITPRKHLPAFIFGLIPALCNWCLGQSEIFTRMLFERVGANMTINFSEPNIWKRDPKLYGIYLLGSNYLLTSIVFGSIIIFIINRSFCMGFIWCMFGAVCSLFGLMHAVRLDVLIQKESMGWQFAIGYFLSGLLFLLLHIGQYFKVIPLPNDSSTSTMFDITRSPETSLLVSR